MDYTSPTTARSPPPRTGASCRAVVEISECNSYMLQRLDSLRRVLFLFKWYSLSYHNPSGDWRSVIQHTPPFVISSNVLIYCTGSVVAGLWLQSGTDAGTAICSFGHPGKLMSLSTVRLTSSYLTMILQHNC